MSFNDKTSEKEKLLFAAKEVLPLYAEASNLRGKGAQFPEKRKVTVWLDAIDLKKLDDPDLILFFEIETFVNSGAYPNEEKVMRVQKRPDLSAFSGLLRGLEKKFYETPFKKFCYQLSLLQKYFKYLGQIRDSDRWVVAQLQSVLLDLHLELLTMNFFEDGDVQAIFAARHNLMASQDYDAINTVFVLEVENLVYKLAQKFKVGIYAQEENPTQEFVVKQIVKPEVLLHTFLENDNLKGYGILFQAVLASLYDQDYRLFIERRYLQPMNGKLPFGDEYLTSLLMVFITTLHYLVYQLEK